MNTNNLYYGMLRVSTKIKTHGSDFIDMYTITSSVAFKPGLVLMKKSITGRTVIKDFHTKEKYMTEVPLETGKIFIKIDNLLSFKLSTDDIPERLSKKEILVRSNAVLKELQTYLSSELEQEEKEKNLQKSNVNNK